jgi:hypothetical protein
MQSLLAKDFARKNAMVEKSPTLLPLSDEETSSQRM